MPKLGEFLSFTCKAENAQTLADEVVFLRDNIVIGSAVQKPYRCSPFSDQDSDSYVVTCNDGTDKALSRTKVYKLMIRSVAPKDNGIWWCQTKIGHAKSNNLVIGLPKGERISHTRAVSECTMLLLLLVFVCLFVWLFQNAQCCYCF